VPLGLEGFRADHIDAARDLLDYTLPRHFEGATSPTATAVCQIVAELRFQLTLASDLRRHDHPDADAAREAFDRDLADQEHRAEAVATAQALRELYGPNWEHLLPATAERLQSLCWLDILRRQDDPAALSEALDFHYPERVAA
jgi:cyclopropane fatty-acyl-phospholipid synthase-like methyltransferase